MAAQPSLSHAGVRDVRKLFSRAFTLGDRRKTALKKSGVFGIPPTQVGDAVFQPSRRVPCLSRFSIFPILSVAGVFAVGVSGCASVRPSNFRDWEPDQAVLPTAEFQGDKVTVRNIRKCSYLSDTEYTVHHFDREYDLNKLATVDFIVVPFDQWKALAHTMLSFGFDDGQYLGVSVEVRREKGETYAFLNGIRQKYEIMYVVGHERDLINLRTNYRKSDVYLYRSRATRQQARDLFVDVMNRVNKLAAEPEFYNTFTNNCTTNIVSHINRLAPNRVPYSIHVLLPGLSDRLAYDLGLIDTDLPFEEAKRRAKINYLAEVYRHDTDFSQKIRL